MKKHENAKIPKVRNLSYKRIFRIFLIASFLGYCIEIIFCSIWNGEFINRQGVMYGPFSQIYGLWALLMIIILTPLAKTSRTRLFIGSAFLGWGFEYFCSRIQELAFWTISRDYSKEFLEMDWRTSWKYMFFRWLLGWIFIKYWYVYLTKFLEKQEKKKIWMPLTVILSIFMIFNCTISSLAVTRRSHRVKGEEAKNKLEQMIDIYYPNERMKKVYPSMKILE